MDFILSAVAQNNDVININTLNNIAEIIRKTNSDSKIMTTALFSLISAVVGYIVGIIGTYFTNRHNKKEKKKERILNSISELFPFFKTCKDIKLLDLTLEQKTNAYKNVIAICSNLKDDLEKIIDKHELISFDRNIIQNSFSKYFPNAPSNLFSNIYIDLHKYFNIYNNINNFFSSYISSQNIIIEISIDNLNPNNAKSLNGLFEDLNKKFEEIKDEINKFEDAILKETEKYIKD